MLKTRVITSVFLVILLMIIVFSGRTILGLGIFVLALIGMHEYYNAISNSGYKPVRILGYLMCTPILFLGITEGFEKFGMYIEPFKSIEYLSFSLFVSLIILFSVIIFLNEKYNVVDISLTIFGAFYVAFLFSFIVLTRNMENGFFLVWLIFIGAWSTDTFAYFTGVKFGKTKFLPAISAKKSLEGSIGGVIGCVLVTLLYGYYLNSNHFYENISLAHFAVIGVLNGIISQIGDWAASAIKRYVKIKDYGRLMPGHGGVLDRFDSILFIAPVVYFYITFLIIK
ncbi:MAG: phosphatidate cytidylyltransferase [Clostridiales bacterium]|nr:phosphatidate cytidylyltransferase [Clostridiales bacterium]